MVIRAVLFDLDNTLTDRPRSLAIFAARFYDDFRDFIASPLALVQQVIVSADSDGYRPDHELFDALFTGIRWTCPPERQQVERYWHEMSPRCMVTRDGVMDVLETLRSRGIKLGVITNGQTVTQNMTLDAIGVRGYMQTVLISESAGLNKPDARIFHLALSQVGGVAPPEAVFVGDHPRNDVNGAREAGLHAVWLSGCHDWSDEFLPPEYEIRSIEEVLFIDMLCN